MLHCIAVRDKDLFKLSAPFGAGIAKRGKRSGHVNRATLSPAPIATVQSRRFLPSLRPVENGRPSLAACTPSDSGGPLVSSDGNPHPTLARCQSPSGALTGCATKRAVFDSAKPAYSFQPRAPLSLSETQ